MVGAAGAAVGTRRADTPASASAAVARQVAPPLLLQVVGWLNEKSSGAAGFAFEASLGKL